MNSAINQKANEITASVNAQISNINGQIVDMSAEITVNAQNISQKVSKGDVVSEINQSSDTITLSSNRLVVNSTDFKLTQDGKIIIDADNFKIDEAGNVSVKGSGDFDGSFRVDVPIEGLPEGESASMYIGIDEGP